MTVTPRKLGIALVLSIGLNLFLGGLWSARWFDHRAAPGGFGPMGAPLLFSPGEVLGGAVPPHLGQLVGQHKSELQEHKRGIRDAREQIQRDLEAEPFDPQKLANSLTRLRQETARSQEILHQTLRELAQNMTPAERKRLANFSHGRNRKDRQPKQSDESTDRFR